MNEKRYQINAPSVVSEVIDGEAVIVNMDNGSYYSIDDSGAFVWNAVSSGANLKEVKAMVEESYQASEIDIDATISELMEQFLKEELLVEADESAAATVEAPSAETSDKPFSPPVLKKYNDMEELLLLDPIHEEEGDD